LLAADVITTTDDLAANRQFEISKRQFLSGWDFILQDEDDDQRPSIFVPNTEALMDETPTHTAGSRRNEDIALDLMKFVAMTTGYGRTSSSGVGFQGSGAAAKPEEYANHLLELYGRCLQAVQGKK